MAARVGGLELRDLVYELKAVDWYDIGVQLGVPLNTIKRIGRENPTESRKLSEVLQYWLNNEEATSWEKVVEALKRIDGHNDIVSTIRTKYLLPSSLSKPNDILNDSHLASLLDQLKQSASRWREIGIYLGFHPGELDVIVGRPLLFVEGSTGWLRAMLVDWLQWRPGDARGSTQYATLAALREAVDKAGFGRTASELTLNFRD